MRDTPGEAGHEDFDLGDASSGDGGVKLALFRLEHAGTPEIASAHSGVRLLTCWRSSPGASVNFSM